MSVYIEVILDNKKATTKNNNSIYLLPSVIFQSINQYFMSVHIEVILDNNKKEEKTTTTKQQHISLTIV